MYIMRGKQIFQYIHVKVNLKYEHIDHVRDQLSAKIVYCLNDQFFFGMTDFVFTFEQNLGNV